MPVITNQDINKLDQVDITYTTLDGTDTFTYGNGVKNQMLLLRNGTGGTLAGTFIGDGAPATITCPGVGEVTVTPEDFSVADGGDASFSLNLIATKLSGVVTITGGTGLEAALVSI